MPLFVRKTFLATIAFTEIKKILDDWRMKRNAREEVVGKVLTSYPYAKTFYFLILYIDREIYKVKREGGTIISSVCLKNCGRNRQRKFLPYRCSETPLEKCKR